MPPQNGPTYLDANGNPIGSPAASGKVYLDEGGNPISQPQRAPNPAAQPGAFQTHPGSQIYNARTGNMPEDSDLPAPDSFKGFIRNAVLPFLGIGDTLRSGARALEAKRDVNARQNLTSVAGGQAPSAASPVEQGLEGAGADALRLGSGALSPKGLAIGAGTLVAPQVTAPFLLGEGGYHAIKGGADIYRHGATPENTQEALSGGAEATGGAALAPLGYDAVTRGSLVPRATRAYQETIAPSGQAAAEQVADVENFQRAAPYLSKQATETPVSAKQSSGPLKGQRLGVMNFRQNAQAAAKNLWENEITPRAQVYSAAPIDSTQVAADIRGTLNPNAPADAAKAQTVGNLADFYSQPTSVGEALNRIQALNEDRQVQAYHKALPDKQAEMLGANPELEAKLKAADSLRDRVTDAVSMYGSPEEANYIREARKDYGALSEVAKNLGSAKVPTPESFWQRVGNTVHGVLSPRGAHAYLSNPLDTLFRSADPNSLAAKSSDLLGRAGLTPREGPAIPTSPFAPQPFVAPPGAPQAPPNAAGTVEGTGNPQAPNQLGARGRGALRVNVLPTEHPGEGNYAGLLPGPPAPFEPPPPGPPLPQVGQLPPAGFPPVESNPMWAGRGALAPTWEVPGRSAPSVAPSIQPSSVELPHPTMTVVPQGAPPLSLSQGAPSPQPTGSLPAPPTAGPTALPPLPEPEPINPQEVIDLARELAASRAIPQTTPSGQPISVGGSIGPEDVNSVLREANAARNVQSGLAGNRSDLVGNIREAHRAKLEPKNKSRR